MNDQDPQVVMYYFDAARPEEVRASHGSVVDRNLTVNGHIAINLPDELQTLGWGWESIKKIVVLQGINRSNLSNKKVSKLGSQRLHVVQTDPGMNLAIVLAQTQGEEADAIRVIVGSLSRESVFRVYSPQTDCTVERFIPGG